MSLYLNPPTGNISLSKLEQYCQQRLEFLIQVYECNRNFIALKYLTESLECAADSECLIAGSVKDGISHFSLRLAASDDPNMAIFFIEAESSLFSFRFSCMNEDEKVSFFRSLQKHLIRVNENLIPQNYAKILDVFNELCRTMSYKELAKHCFEGSNDVFVPVPFEHALNLVAKRMVELHKGMAQVPCSRVHEVIATLFESWLKCGMQTAKHRLSRLSDDIRIRRMFRRLRYIFKQHHHPATYEIGAASKITAEDVDDLSTNFPLCMSHLHRQLRSKHRLTHHARIQYSLFLKEVGLPVHEAIKFWKQEYCQPCCHGNGCTHEWKNEEKRYIYNVRHLYGLEGSRINYRGHACKTIQGRQLGAQEEGGCPFVHFDTKYLLKAMDIEDIGLEAQCKIARIAANNETMAACTCYFVEKAKHGLVKNLSYKGISRVEKVIPSLNDNTDMETNKSSELAVDEMCNTVSMDTEMGACTAVNLDETNSCIYSIQHNANVANDVKNCKYSYQANSFKVPKEIEDDIDSHSKRGAQQLLDVHETCLHTKVHNYDNGYDCFRKEPGLGRGSDKEDRRHIDNEVKEVNNVDIVDLECGRADKFGCTTYRKFVYANTEYQKNGNPHDAYEYLFDYDNVKQMKTDIICVNCGQTLYGMNHHNCCSCRMYSKIATVSPNTGNTKQIGVSGHSDTDIKMAKPVEFYFNLLQIIPHNN